MPGCDVKELNSDMHTQTQAACEVGLVFDVSWLTKRLPPIEGLQINTNGKRRIHKRWPVCLKWRLFWISSLCFCFGSKRTTWRFVLFFSCLFKDVLPVLARHDKSLVFAITMKSGPCTESDSSTGQTTSKLACLLVPSSMMRYFLRLCLQFGAQLSD